MSGDLNPKQFEQLRMFVPTEEISNEYIKADAIDSGDDPTLQWTGGVDDEGQRYENLRDLKRAELRLPWWGSDDRRSRGQYFDDTRSTHSFPPVQLRKYEDDYHLMDGHHRLAYAEREGMEMMPVQHYPELKRWSGPPAPSNRGRAS